MDSIEVTAKRVEDALKEGLTQLSATIDDVNVQVLEAGGLFTKARLIVSLTDEVREKRERKRESFNAQKPKNQGEKHFEKQPQEKRFEKPQRKTDETEREVGKKPPENSRQQAAQKPQEKPQTKQEPPKERVKPEMKQKSTAPSEVPEKAVADVKRFLEETLKKMSVEAQIEIEGHGYDLDVDLNTEDIAVIGYRGEALDSLEYLAGLVANRESEKYIKLSLDSAGYREKQVDSLVKFAEKMAAKCVKQGRKVSLDPMNSASRKVIHAALSNNDKVITKSEGKEPNRRIVIYCKRERTE